MPVSAEVIKDNQYLAIDLSELASDNLLRHRARKFIGQVALGAIVEHPSKIKSLDEGLELAAQGDSEARAMVEANVSSDYLERNNKVGFITPKVPLSIKDGQLHQHGQSYQSMLANALRYTNHPIMHQRTLAEVNNGFRLNELWLQNAYDDYSLAIFSLAEDRPDLGFFTDTMSCSIQLVSKEGDGLAIESAFVAGKNNQAQFDLATVTKIYADMAGVDISGLTAAEIIDRPLLIPNELLSDGVVDLVKIYDKLAGDTFFGMDQKNGDYQQVKLQAKDWQNNKRAITSQITDRLISEAPSLKTPLRATRRLNEIAASISLEQAAIDTSIDPRVFGAVAARHLIAARDYLAHGGYQQFMQSMNLASAVNRSSSCPSALGDINTTKDLDNELERSSDEPMDCDFVSKECPYCKKKNVKTTVKQGVFYGECGCSSSHGRSIIKKHEPKETHRAA